MDMDKNGDWWFWWVNRKSEKQHLEEASIFEVSDSDER
jgi:hypothetical protein